MLTTIVVMPLCFAAGMYGFIEVVKIADGRLIVIYPGLFAAVTIPAFLWFGLRRLATRLDVQRAERHRNVPLPADKLERLIE